MKVICIDNLGHHYHLTEGKIYNVESVLNQHLMKIDQFTDEGEYFYVLNDHNARCPYLKHRFKLLEEIRDEKLSQIL